jgi:hypothetical protein
MYLAPKINRRLDKMRAVLTGSVPLEVVHEQVEHVAPLQLIAELNALEADIQAGLKQLEGMLK